MTVVVTAEIHWFELSETQRRGQLSINTFKNHIYIYIYIYVQLYMYNQL